MARAQIIFDLAAEHRIDHLILGGWGCGVFGCPPVLVAETLKHLTPDDLDVTYAFLDENLMKEFEKVYK